MSAPPIMDDATPFALNLDLPATDDGAMLPSSTEAGGMDFSDIGGFDFSFGGPAADSADASTAHTSGGVDPSFSDLFGGPRTSNAIPTTTDGSAGAPAAETSTFSMEGFGDFSLIPGGPQDQPVAMPGVLPTADVPDAPNPIAMIPAATEPSATAATGDAVAVSPNDGIAAEPQPRPPTAGAPTMTTSSAAGHQRRVSFKDPHAQSQEPSVRLPANRNNTSAPRATHPTPVASREGSIRTGQHSRTSGTTTMPPTTITTPQCVDKAGHTPAPRGLASAAPPLPAAPKQDLTSHQEAMMKFRQFIAEAKQRQQATAQAAESTAAHDSKDHAARIDNTRTLIGMLHDEATHAALLGMEMLQGMGPLQDLAELVHLPSETPLFKLVPAIVYAVDEGAAVHRARVMAARHHGGNCNSLHIDDKYRCFE